MPIPEVPFAEYDVSYSDTQKLYMIVDISASEARADHAVLSAYCDTLKNAGYTTIEKDVLSADVFQTEVSSMGASTLFAAGNPDGLRVMVYQEESTPMVWVYAPN